MNTESHESGNKISRRGLIERGGKVAAVIAVEGVAGQLIEGGVITSEENQKKAERLGQFSKMLESIAVATGSQNISPHLEEPLGQLSGEFGDSPFTNELHETVVSTQFESREERFRGVFSKAQNILTTNFKDITGYAPSQPPLTGDDKTTLAEIIAYAGSAWDTHNTQKTDLYLSLPDALYSPAIDNRITSVTITTTEGEVTGAPLKLFLQELDKGAKQLLAP